MSVIECPVCGSRVNALVAHCPQCGAEPRLSRAAAEADLRARGIPLPRVGMDPRSMDGAPPGPAAWPAVVGAALFIFWGLTALPQWLALAFLLVYPLFVVTAEHRRCRELGLSVTGGLHLLLGIAAGVLWAVLPAVSSAAFTGATATTYTDLADGALLGLILCAGVAAPLFFGLLFRYAEQWTGSFCALVVVTVVYVASGFVNGVSLTAAGVALPALTALVCALGYVLTRRLWLTIGLRAGMAVLATEAPVFGLDLVRLTVFPSPRPQLTLHLVLLAGAALVMFAVALRRGALLGRRRAWKAQTGRPLPPPAPTSAPAAPAPRASVWAALGCAVVLDAVYWFTDGPRFWLAAAVPLLYLVYVRLVECRSCPELGGGPARATLAVVAGLGAGFLVGLVSWLPDAGPFAATSFTWPPWLTAGLVASALLWALAEEVVWRGLLVRTIEHRLGSIWALAVTAVAFAVWHFRWEPFAMLDVAVAGTVFGAAYVLTRRLWLPTGIHAGWNLAIWAWTETGYRNGYIYLAVLSLQALAVIVMLVVAQQRGRMVSRPRLGGFAVGPGDAAGDAAMAVPVPATGRRAKAPPGTVPPVTRGATPTTVAPTAAVPPQVVAPSVALPPAVAPSVALPPAGAPPSPAAPEGPVR